MLHFTMLLAFCLVSLIFSFTRIYGLLGLVALALWHPIAVALTLAGIGVLWLCLKF
jgi:hypothetical protein